MPKGFFTQGVVVLFEAAPTRLQLRAAVADQFEVARESDGGDNWALGGDGLIITYRPDVNGYVNIDIVDRTWPDDMGDPQQDVDVFAAWSFGHFGPYAFPNNLQRAVDHNVAWEGSADAGARHKAFARVRLSYIFGAPGDAPVLPKEYDPMHELQFVISAARALLSLPGALALFNPNGEVLVDAAMLERAYAWAAENDLPALDIMANIRFFKINDDWALMDTVGNAQLDVPDLEAAFQPAKTDPNEVAALLRNITSYMLENGAVIEDGHTVDGPGGETWGVRAFSDGLSSPPRSVLCLLPDGAEPPAEVLDRKQEEE